MSPALIPWWRALVGALAVFPAAFLLGQCDGRESERRAVKARADVAAAELKLRGVQATAKADVQRPKDTAAVQAAKQETINAVAPIPDAAPSVRRNALACVRLCLQGTDPATVPACRGPEARAATASHAGCAGLRRGS